MASFLTDLVKPYVEKLINGAITESSYICCFTCIAKDFEDEKIRLEVERTTFDQRIDVATRRGEDVQANALLWKKEVEELIQEDTKTKQKCFFGFCCDCIWRYKRGKELANKKEQIKKLMETGKELEIGLPAYLPDIERHSSQHYIPFESRKSKYKELLDALYDENNYIVGLQGMGGTGKTTLAKEVGKELKRSNQFTHVIDTTVSFSPDIKKIQDDIAGPLGLKFDDCNESDRPKKLWSRLTNGEKILIILDDVWGDINFDEIGIPQSDNRKGCRVFVTTRNLQVCNRLGCSRTIQLDLLSEDDAWIMFQRHAGLSKVSTKNLLDRGRKIVNECKRLPIAIAAIASSLKGEQRQEKWDVALNSLQKHMSIRGVDEDLVDIYKCLKFSYDYLKNKNAEELFLLCSIFQEDAEIRTQILTRLGIGVGLFGESYDKYNNARNLVVVAKDKLLDSCLLLKTNKGDVKMHDLVREVAQWIANKEILAVNVSNKNQNSLVGRNNIKYLLFDGSPNDLCSPMFDGSKLRILILIMVTSCFVDSFFENIAGLRVLNLIAGKKITISLPRSIQSLTNIRSLLVESADLGDISVLGNLQSLETLDLNHCTIDELPQEIAKLKELRLLNLEYCRIKSNNPFEVIQICPSLEELYFFKSFNGFCQEITLPTLERYHLTDVYGIICDSSLSKCVILEKDYLSEATFKHVMQTAELLKLVRIKKGWRNIMPEFVPIDQGMNDLIELHLNDDSQLQFLIDTKHTGSQVPNVFSKLVVLELIKMKNLEELCNGPISFDSMNNLEELTIKSCGNLRSLFKGNLNLCNLKTVKIERCSTLVSVFHLSTSASLPLLEELNISECGNLENIFTCERTIEEILVPKLKVVKIESCNKLTYIFDQEVKLTLLIELKLEYVSNFIDIFPKSYNSIEGSSSSNSISKPQTQLQVKPLKSNIIFSWSHICCYRYKLKGATSTKVPLVSQDQPQACSISTETSSYCPNIWKRAQCLSRLSHIICNIKKITLANVSKIKSVFMLSIAPKMLLESLTIYCCYELEHIVVDCGDCSDGIELGNVFPKLKELDVDYCRKLKYIFGHINASDDHDHNSNEIQLHLPALKTLKLVDLKSLIGMSPKQYHITFSPLKEVELKECSQVDVKSIGDFTFLASISRYQDSTTIKEFSGNMEHLLALEMLNVSKSNVENLDLLVFSTSILRCLSQLSHLRIQECNELKHIIEDDDDDDIENQGMSKTYFPVLKTLAVAMCNKLKSVFPISMKKELPPELKVMMIGEAHELKEIFKSVGGDNQKVEIPNLKSVVFVNLPSLCHVQGIQFQAVENHYIQNCKELSPTSLTSSRNFGRHAFRIDCIDFDVHVNLIGLFQQLKNMMAASSQKEMNRTPETKHEFIENVPDLEIPSVTTLPTNSQELTSEESTSQHLLEEIDNTIKLSQLEGSMSTISETRNVPPIHLVDLKQKGIRVSVEEGTASTSYANTITSSTHLESEYGDGQIGIPFPVSTTDCLNIADVNLGDSHETTQTNNQVSLNDNAAMQVSSTIQQQFHKDDGIIVSGLEMPSAVYSPTNSQLEGSTSEKTTEAATMFTTSELKNEPDGMKISVEDGTTSANAKTITSSTHSKSVSSSSGLSTTSKSETSSPEDGDGKISIPSFSTVNTKPPATKYVDIGDSQEIIAMEDINMLIEEDPLLALLALEKLLTGQFSNSSARVLLQELKTLMDSSSDLDHLVSNQESISKLNSLFHRLNQYQGMLTSDLKDFVEKVQNFFNENIIRHATAQQVLKKHNQLLDSKTDLMNKLWSVKSIQTHIDSETSTTNAQIHGLSLQIDELTKKLADLENQRDSLKSVANKCDVQKMKLKAECTELVQQSKKFFSALASSEVDLREAEHARDLAKEGFANLKSSFPRY
ncbi:unnamed protein product [Trifolium pratense]|uniref:Uncharacterized protein n=1 Tax=Trifolium pratense TaxID=57577 RepID=A0ACB0J635_TRIPR|nr:unnamed protein product [Trifolium pratense]